MLQKETVTAENMWLSKIWLLLKQGFLMLWFYQNYMTDHSRDTYDKEPINYHKLSKIILKDDVF